MCRHWRLVAIDYAILWNNIAFTTSVLPTIGCATTFLQRSRGTPLHVHIWDIPRHLSSHIPLQHAFTRLLSLISSQRHRIVLLEVIGPSIHLLDAFQGPANNVSKLILHGRIPMNHSSPFFAKLPNVQQITLICPTPCRLGSLASLTEVTLHSGPRKWNIDAFLDCVDGCSSLKSLSVVRYLGFYPGKDSTRIVSLPSIVNLHLHTCDAATILRHLNLPATASVSVCTNVKHISNHFDSIFSCIPQEIDRVNFLQNTGSLTIVFDEVHGDFHISGFNGATLVFLLQVCGPLAWLDDDWVHRSFTAATNILPFSGITSLTLVVESAHVPWESWLRRSNHLSTLDVCCTDVRELMVALNRTQNGIPLCHTLKNLSINVRRGSWSRHENLLMSAIRLRKIHGSALSSLTINTDEWDDIQRLDPTWTGFARREGP